VSVPVLIVSLSLPSPPVNESFPVPPTTVSFPDPPVNVRAALSETAAEIATLAVDFDASMTAEVVPSKSMALVIVRADVALITTVFRDAAPESVTGVFQ